MQAKEEGEGEGDREGGHRMVPFALAGATKNEIVVVVAAAGFVGVNIGQPVGSAEIFHARDF